MDRSIHVYGGFVLSPRMAALIKEVVDEITRETFGEDLSHVDGHCPVCEPDPAASRRS